uniref:Ionotropic receptor 3 n=1 Tax=Holotrichia parallela TaxID=93412 RepID=A0A2P9JY86_HOLPA|nr:ionotropic receptor 3 [Holotrichia parallela]
MDLYENVDFHSTLLANIIIDTYFNETTGCLFVFTDVGRYFDYRGNRSKVIFTADNGTINSELVFNQFGCSGFIVYSDNPRTLFENLEENIRYSDERYNTRRYLFVPLNGAAENALTIFESRYVQFVADIVGIIQSNRTKNVLSFDIITHRYVGREHHDQVEILDTWFANNKTFSIGNYLYPNKLKNQLGRTLRLGTIVYHPFTDVDTTDGIDWYSIKELVKKLNTTYEIVKENKESSSWFGQVHPNFTGDGLFGNLAEDRIDIGFGALYQWDDFHHYMDYSQPSVQTTVTCLVPRPQMLGGWLTPFIAFSGPIWIALGLIVLISIPSLYFTLAWDRLKRFKSIKVKSIELLLDSTLQTQAMYVNQSVGYIPENFSSRLVFASILTMSLILGSIYDSGLASNMTIPRYYGIIRTAKDMVDNKLPWGGADPEYIYSLANSQSATPREMVKLFILENEEELRARNDEKWFAYGIERLPEGNFVVIDYITAEGVKIRKALEEPLYTGYTVFSARKSSVLLPYMDDVILRSAQAGLISKWEYEAVEKYSVVNILKILKDNDPSHVMGPTKLKLSHVEGGFYILIIGLLISTFCFIVEVLIHKI